MKRNILFSIAAVFILIMASVAVAQQGQNRRGPGTATPPAGPQSVIAGNVVSFTAAVGAGMPALIVDQAGKQITLVLGPFWFLQNSKFTAAAGESIEATVIACTECDHDFAVVSVKNLTNGTSVLLRNEDGLPLWQSNANGGRMGNGSFRGRRGAGLGAGMGAGLGSCDRSGPDMARVATFNGTVASFTGGPGVGRPTLVLNTGAGAQEFLVAPYHAVLEAGLEFVPGASFTVTAAPNEDNEWVVLTLKDNATGAELVLRDAETGIGPGRRGRRN